jgi:hypothetical protein
LEDSASCGVLSHGSSVRDDMLAPVRDLETVRCLIVVMSFWVHGPISCRAIAVDMMESQVDDVFWEYQR